MSSVANPWLTVAASKMPFDVARGNHFATLQGTHGDQEAACFGQLYSPRVVLRRIQR